jgi:hypothetical protein
MKNKEVVEMRVCHCGKCKIKCNKHGQRAKCAECGKVRMLGTESKLGVVRHICGKCCDKLMAIQIEQNKKEISEALKELKKKEDEDQEEKRLYRLEEDERVLSIPETNEVYAWM